MVVTIDDYSHWSIIGRNVEVAVAAINVSCSLNQRRIEKNHVGLLGFCWTLVTRVMFRIHGAIPKKTTLNLT